MGNVDISYVDQNKVKIFNCYYYETARPCVLMIKLNNIKKNYNNDVLTNNCVNQSCDIAP